MVFIRLKRVKHYYYIYVVKNYWNKEKQSPRQKVIGYLGKAKALKNIDVAEVFKRDGYSCQICGYMQDLTIDHKVPLCKNGSNEMENLWTLCKKCNAKKGKKIIEQPKIQQYTNFYW